MDQKLFVNALRTGRLANRLVLFAHFIGFAEEKGCRLINVAFHSYADLFETTRRDIYCQYPVPARKSRMDTLPGIANAIRKTRIFYHLVRPTAVLNARFQPFGKKVVTLQEIRGQPMTLLDGPEVQEQIAGAKIIFAYGWGLRAPDLVSRHAEKIRAYFRPIAKVETRSRQTMERLRQRGDVVVGVHVRRGDYQGWKQGRFYFPVERYAAWMREMAEQFPGRKTAFFVCSDEPRSRNEFEGLTVEIGGGPPVTDLYTLARCDYVFGPPSTFSQWASFYGNTPMLHLQNPGATIDREKFAVSHLLEIP